MGPLTVALDAMGGDIGPQAVVPAAITILKKYPDVHLILVGDESVLKTMLLKHAGYDIHRLRLHHASDVIGMDELPSKAFRKRDTSMRVMIQLVKEEQAQACVSAGNTGALMLTARFVLKMLPGLDRPAIVTTLPTQRGHVRVLDLGANVDCCSTHLFQFAVMGSALASAVDGMNNPRVALLNIGEEEIKGNDQIKQTAQLLSAEKNINYVGFVEGNDVFNDLADVIVCDGFVGNVLLKTTEGVASMMGHFVKEAFSQHPLGKIAGAVAKPILKRVWQRMDPARHNGASLVGLSGIVIKSHGSADAFAFSSAIEEAICEVKKNVPDRIAGHVSALLS